MREIKFRVYRKDLSKYHYYNKHSIGSYHEEWSDDMLNAGVVEQFTGLHDKNGTELYCGDKAKQWNATYIVKSLQQVGALSSEGYLTEGDFEIVGNIH